MANRDKKSSVSESTKKPHIKRKGIHAKKKASYSKASKHYLKKYVGQGK